MDVVVALVICAAPAVAAPPHNLRLTSILPDSAKLVIDGGPTKNIDANTVNFYYFAPGQHSFVLTTVQGESISLNANLSDDLMATSRGRSWWCVVTGRRSADNVLVLILETPAQCADALAAVPEHDDPSDDP
jgi:hypothetical protein